MRLSRVQKLYATIHPELHWRCELYVVAKNVADELSCHESKSFLCRKRICGAQEKTLLEREVSKLPDTMEIAKISKEEKEKSKKEMVKADKYTEEINDLEKQIRILALKKGEKEVSLQRHLTAARRHERNSKRPDALEHANDAVDNRTKEKKRFIMPCPSEECRGFLSNQYKCELCSIHACPKCLECIGTDKNADHTCNEDNVKSAEMIRKETRPCPSCGTRIYKIDGCDQMWCVECHTAFSWNTGNIDNGRVHNPHFYEHRRNQNNGIIARAPGDVLCGGLCNTDQIEANIIPKMKIEAGDIVTIDELHRLPGTQRDQLRTLRGHLYGTIKICGVAGEVKGTNGPGHIVIDFKRENVNDCHLCRGPCHANKWNGTHKVRKSCIFHQARRVVQIRRFVSHITYYSLRNMRRLAADDQHENTIKMLRVAYILGDLSKEKACVESL